MRKLALALVMCGASTVQADVIFFQDFVGFNNQPGGTETIQTPLGDGFAYNAVNEDVRISGSNYTGAPGGTLRVGSVYQLAFDTSGLGINLTGNSQLSFDLAGRMEANYDFLAVVGAQAGAGSIDFLPILNTTGGIAAADLAAMGSAIAVGTSQTLDATGVSPYSTWGTVGGSNNILNEQSNDSSSLPPGTSVTVDLDGLLDNGQLDIILQIGLARDTTVTYSGYRLDNVQISADLAPPISIPLPTSLVLFLSGLLWLPLLIGNPLAGRNKLVIGR